MSKLLYALTQGSIRKRYKDTIKLDGLDRYGRLLHKDLLNFVAQNEMEDVSIGEWREHFFNVSHTNIEYKDKETYTKIFDTLQRLHEEDEDLEEYINNWEAKILASKLMHGLEEITCKSDMDELIPQIEEEIKEYQSTSQEEDEEDIIIPPKLEEIFAYTEDTTSGMQWPNEILQNHLGSLRKGLFYIIAARPEVGKTSFLSYLVANIAKQMKGIVLWFNNEQAGQDVMLRIFQAASRRSQERIRTNMEQAQKYYDTTIGDRIKVVNIPYISLSKVKELCSLYNPELIVFDQLAKIQLGGGKKDMATHELYTFLAREARELSKLYGPVFGVHQLGAPAQDKMFPELSDLMGSKTGLQGEADVILMMGVDKHEPNKRGFITRKNKVGDVRTEYRHQPFALQANFEVCSFKEYV